ncbi:uncharacterized protein L969DRAFT_95769 [Mixia osmundae IAM 14324]|uniref:Uncharacterized protein n=1 Tax=Mixia osmundae (strain CBS 9802 / IAM 14324 / JCM 22182 / KY 12970) TaxID=764103 RepID=G7DSM5_MIXOS|nr:uncharacterized protein L969DRAFT_95769 [Mixia osmundae IAM 14324]KEI37919.1 hypothetical protein L969DRAFT_95769 [Mixia osmundae IAM 14324]GAA93585.1 hypothetical protein E5Q_00229 [Mixia osmundae IAM 14324]
MAFPKHDKTRLPSTSIEQLASLRACEGGLVRMSDGTRAPIEIPRAVPFGRAVLKNASDAATFHEQSPFANGVKMGLSSAVVGTMVSAIQNSIGRHSQGAMGVFTRSGTTIGLFGAMGFTFAFMDARLANFREIEDPLNSAFGACAAGFLGGISKGGLASGISGCAVGGALLGTFGYAGSSMVGANLESKTLEEREELRKSFFKKRDLLDSVPKYEPIQSKSS